LRQDPISALRGWLLLRLRIKIEHGFEERFPEDHQQCDESRHCPDRRDSDLIRRPRATSAEEGTVDAEVT